MFHVPAHKNVEHPAAQAAYDARVFEIEQVRSALKQWFPASDYPHVEPFKVFN